MRPSGNVIAPFMTGEWGGGGDALSILSSRLDSPKVPGVKITLMICTFQESLGVKLTGSSQDSEEAIPINKFKFIPNSDR